MAVKIRLQRGGAKGKPMYRMVVAEAAAKRDGRFVEILGTYDPKNKVNGRQVRLDLERADYWMGVGAQPSDTARSLINRAKREATARASEAPAPAAKPAATKQEIVGDRSSRTAPSASAPAEGDAAAAAGEGSTVGGQPSAAAAEREAREVAQRAAEQSPTGDLAAGGTGATGVAPTEASDAAKGNA